MHQRVSPRSISAKLTNPVISRRPIPLTASDLPTVCVLCSHNCGIRVDVIDGQIHKVRGDHTNPITHGYVCNKAASVGHYASHAQRVLTPLKRQANGSHRAIDWSEAIAEISTKLRRIQRAHGGEAIAMVGIGGQANHIEAPYALGLLCALGSTRWFSAYAQEKTQNHLVDEWLLQASPSLMLHADTDQARYLLVMGTNPRISNRGHAANWTFRALERDPARRVVVVDPRVTETSRGADLHLRVHPSSDVHLMLAMAATIVKRGLTNDAYMDRYVAGAASIISVLRALDVAELCGRCGIDSAVVEEEASRFAKARGAAILWDLASRTCEPQISHFRQLETRQAPPNQTSAHEPIACQYALETRGPCSGRQIKLQLPRHRRSPTATARLHSSENLGRLLRRLCNGYEPRGTLTLGARQNVHGKDTSQEPSPRMTTL